MNISFEGHIISNTLPTAASNQPAGTSIKRSRAAAHSSNKRFRRDRHAITTIPPMGDDSFSSHNSASLDDLAESLRECSQRLDSSLRALDFSGNSHVGTFNASLTSLGDSFRGGLTSNFHSTGSTGTTNTAPLPPSLLGASLGSISRPPPLMSFHRVPRDNPDRL